MKRFLIHGLIFVWVLCLFSGCAGKQTAETSPTHIQTTETTVPKHTDAPGTSEPMSETTAPETTVPEETTIPEETTTPVTTPEHSSLYIPGVSVEDVITYFNEVCLNAEFIHSGDPTKLQKWATPIWYTCTGAYTDTDAQVMHTFMDWLNTIEGFPGIYETQDPALANLQISFCDESAYLTLMGDTFIDTDGGVTFWYNGFDEIYNAIIAYRTDVSQEIRNSVILEEIYNGLGPINDTQLRLDSVIYSGFSTPQNLTLIDELILKLLYHPQMQCGMDAASCEAVIRQLYY